MKINGTIKFIQIDRNIQCKKIKYYKRQQSFYYATHRLEVYCCWSRYCNKQSFKYIITMDQGA